MAGWWLLVAAWLFLLVTPGRAVAVDLAVLGGSETDFRGQSYSFVGADATQRVHENVGLAGRIMPHFMTYRFRSGDDLVKAEAVGVNGLLGVKFFLGPVTLGLLGGVQFRDTDLTPDVKSAGARGTQAAALGQADLDATLPTRTNIYVFSSLSAIDDFVYARAAVKQQVTNYDYQRANTVNVGVEGIYGNNRDYESKGAGLIFEVYNIPAKLSVAIRGGYKHDSTFGAGGYGSLVIYKAF